MAHIKVVKRKPDGAFAMKEAVQVQCHNSMASRFQSIQTLDL